MGKVQWNALQIGDRPQRIAQQQGQHRSGLGFAGFILHHTLIHALLDGVERVYRKVRRVDSHIVILVHSLTVTEPGDPGSRMPDGDAGKDVLSGDRTVQGSWSLDDVWRCGDLHLENLCAGE